MKKRNARLKAARRYLRYLIANHPQTVVPESVIREYNRQARKRRSIWS